MSGGEWLMPFCYAAVDSSGPTVDSQTCCYPHARPHAIHSLDGAELLWPNDSGDPVDRLTLLAELLAERFGLPKTSRNRE